MGFYTSSHGFTIFHCCAVTSTCPEVETWEWVAALELSTRARCFLNRHPLTPQPFPTEKPNVWPQCRLILTYIAKWCSVDFIGEWWWMSMRHHVGADSYCLLCSLVRRFRRDTMLWDFARQLNQPQDCEGTRLLQPTWVEFFLQMLRAIFKGSTGDVTNIKSRMSATNCHSTWINLKNYAGWKGFFRAMIDTLK